VRGPEDIEVVAQCNFPHTQRAAVEVTWLGLDIPAILATAADLAESQVAGRPTRTVRWVETVFEHERPRASIDADASQPGREEVGRPAATRPMAKE